MFSSRWMCLGFVTITLFLISRQYPQRNIKNIILRNSFLIVLNGSPTFASRKETVTRLMNILKSFNMALNFKKLTMKIRRKPRNRPTSVTTTTTTLHPQQKPHKTEHSTPITVGRKPKTHTTPESHQPTEPESHYSATNVSKASNVTTLPVINTGDSASVNIILELESPTSSTTPKTPPSTADSVTEILIESDDDDNEKEDSAALPQKMLKSSLYKNLKHASSLASLLTQAGQDEYDEPVVPIEERKIETFFKDLDDFILIYAITGIIKDFIVTVEDRSLVFNQAKHFPKTQTSITDTFNHYWLKFIGDKADHIHSESKKKEIIQNYFVKFWVELIMQKFLSHLVKQMNIEAAKIQSWADLLDSLVPPPQESKQPTAPTTLTPQAVKTPTPVDEFKNELKEMSNGGENLQTLKNSLAHFINLSKHLTELHSSVMEMVEIKMKPDSEVTLSDESAKKLLEKIRKNIQENPKAMEEIKKF